MMIKDNMKEFMKDVSLELEHFERDAEEVIKKAILLSHGTLTALSPVDSGRYKASHFISKRQESSEVAEDGKADYSNDSKARADEAKNAIPKLENISWFVTNNLEYAESLEAGHSPQAPNGVYAPATIIVDKEMQRIVRQLNSQVRK